MQEQDPHKAGEPPQYKARGIGAGDGNKKTSHRKVEFGGERLKPDVISLTLIIKKAHYCRVTLKG